MAKNRLTKKQLQTDELQHALVDARDYVVSHRSQTTRLVAIAAGTVALVGGIWLGISYRNGRLAERLSHAVGTLDAPLVTDGVAAPGQKVFKDAAERTAEVKKELTALANDAPSSQSGQAAALLLISLEGTQAVTGARADAVKSFARSESGSITAGIAAVSLLDAQAASGRATEAIETAKKFLEASDNPVPKDILIFTLAHLYEKAGKPVEARSFYQRVVSDFPDSPMRNDAQKRVAAL